MSTAPASPSRRIVMVAHSHKLGGIERHVAALARVLAAAGHQVAYAGPMDGWLGAAMAAGGHTCLHLPMHGMYDPLSAFRLRRFARRWGADLIHGHAQRGTRYARWAGGGRIPVVATAHSTTAWKWFGPDHPVLAVSGAVRAFLLDKGLSPAMVRLVHLGVPDLGLATPPSPGPISADRPLMLGILGRMEKVKGHDIALDALALLPAEMPAKLVFIGADTTDWAAQMKARVAGTDLEARVAFWGQRADIKPVFDAMDIMLAPSRREALSLSLIEAAAAGRPAIGADLGGIPEVIERDVSGLLVEREDPQALAEAIVRLGRDGDLRARMGAAGRAIFETRFTEDAMLAGVLAGYEGALAQGG